MWILYLLLGLVLLYLFKVNPLLCIVAITSIVIFMGWRRRSRVKPLAGARDANMILALLALRLLDRDSLSHSLAGHGPESDPLEGLFRDGCDS